MNRRPTQSGVRENTASSRQHASRLAMSAMQSQSSEPPLVVHVSGPSAAQTPPKPANGAKVEEKGKGNRPQTYMASSQKQVVEHYVCAAEAAKLLSIHPCRVSLEAEVQKSVPATNGLGLCFT